MPSTGWIVLDPFTPEMVKLIVNLMLCTINPGVTPLSTSMRVISEKINWSGETHPECGATTS